jgi:hypothetical protein
MSQFLLYFTYINLNIFFIIINYIALNYYFKIDLIEILPLITNYIKIVITEIIKSLDNFYL